jgi:hypothetical protein
MRMTATGRTYFVDHNTKKTSWYPPTSGSEGPPGYENLPTPTTTTKFQTLRGHNGAVLCMAVSSNGERVATGGEDQTIRIWDADSGSLVGDPLEGNASSVTCVAFSPDDMLIVSGSDDGGVRVWDRKLNKIVVHSSGHTDTVRSVVFSPSGSLIASVSDDKTCRIWDSRTGNMVKGPLQGHSQAVRSVCFTADSTRVATGSSDRTIRLWDVQSGAPICQPLKGLKNSTRMLAFTKDGKRVVGGSKERRFCIWNAESGALISGPDVRIGRSVLASLFRPDCHCLTASADGLWLATGTLSANIFKTDDMNIQFWDPDTGKRVRMTDRANNGLIKCLAFSPDGRRVFIGDGDSNIEVYSMG